METDRKLNGNMYRLDYAGALMSVGCRKDYTTSFLAHHVISFRSYYYVPMLALHYANKKKLCSGLLSLH